MENGKRTPRSSEKASEVSLVSASASRREFIKTGVFGFVAATLLVLFRQVLGKSAVALAADDRVKESDPMAQSLGYHTNAKKVDTKKWPKRAGAEGAKQFCWRCQFYQAKGDPKTTKSAPCTIFQNKVVMAGGWCNTWTPNPNIKS